MILYFRILPQVRDNGLLFCSSGVLLLVKFKYQTTHTHKHTHTHTQLRVSQVIHKSLYIKSSTQTPMLDAIQGNKSTGRGKMFPMLMVLSSLPFLEFDSIPHRKLLLKIPNYNISDATIKWFHSYLSDRHQTVIDDKGTECIWYRVLAGVSQGSVLVPLLFAIFINDLPSKLVFSNHMTYADDSQIYHHCLPYKILHDIELIQRDAQAVAD